MGTGREQAAERTLVTNHEWTGLWLSPRVLNHEQALKSTQDYVLKKKDYT